ncbi:hypothetical protein [Apilactobacillus timberlakei]|uniref:hypothetical protein n=1 Tax=Apilactobacillus timberlakei TaxID=2008380 RepID=UPI0011287F84|nr:hypothetical protein [Apilactobacillus timberlakei]TPR16734.1 hypothetical protein DYZ95_07070 [Apilactobacillus timberlakei]TPR21497.1 hypothetical protein DY083_05620 [Apilactobacillus timberlakei]
MTEIFSNIWKYLVFGIIVAGMLALGIFFYAMGQTSSFQDKASSIIAENGGIISDNGKYNETQKELTNLSKNYGGRFKVVIDKDTPKEHQSQGTPINYKINTSIPIRIYNFNNVRNAYISSVYGG